MARAIHILQQGSTGQDLLNLATIASVDAQARTPKIKHSSSYTA